MADLGSPAIIGGGGAVTEAEETAINAALGICTAENPAVAGDDPTRDVTTKSIESESALLSQSAIITNAISGDSAEYDEEGIFLGDGDSRQITRENLKAIPETASTEVPLALSTDSRFPTAAAAAALAANTDLSATNPVGDRATSIGPWVLGRAYSFPMIVVSQENNGFFLSIDTPTAHTATADDEPGEGVNSAAHWLQIGQLTTAAEVSNIPSADQKASFAGTSGTPPSADNKLVDNADTRMTNARTPSAHAASHVTGADQISDATAEAHGLMTAAQFSKLGGVEAGANVTDAENVAAAGAVMESDQATVKTYADVAAAEAASGTNNPLCYVADTNIASFYNYIAAGGSYTRDGTFVLNTADGGNTRWIGVGGKYVYGNISTKAHIGIGTSDFESYHSTMQVLQGPLQSICFRNASNYLDIVSNAYINAGGNWLRRAVGYASWFSLFSGLVLSTATTGSADSGITWVQQLNVPNGGGLLVGTTDPGGWFRVYRDVTGATTPLVWLHQDHASNTGILVKGVHDGTGYVHRWERPVTVDATGGVSQFFRGRNAAAGVDADVLWELQFRGLNDAGTPEETGYAALITGIVDASDGTEDGYISLQTMLGGALTEGLYIGGDGWGLKGHTSKTLSTGWSVTNLTSDKTLDCNANDDLQTADVLGTLITELIAKGVIAA